MLKYVLGLMLTLGALEINTASRLMKQSLVKLSPTNHQATSCNFTGTRKISDNKHKDAKTGYIKLICELTRTCSRCRQSCACRLPLLKVYDLERVFDMTYLVQNVKSKNKKYPASKCCYSDSCLKLALDIVDRDHEDVMKRLMVEELLSQWEKQG